MPISGASACMRSTSMARPVWSKEMDALEYRHGWGSGASPILHEDRLYIVNDNDGQSFLAAYDKRTGEELMRVDRDEGSNWATPFIWENNLRTEIITAGSDQGALVRPGRRAAVGTDRHDLDHRADAVCRARPAVRQLRLPLRSGAAGVRHPARRDRRHHAAGRPRPQRVHRVVESEARNLQHVVARVRRLPLHAARPRLPDLHGRPHRPRGVFAEADRAARHRVHRLAVGLQR